MGAEGMYHLVETRAEEMMRYRKIYQFAKKHPDADKLINNIMNGIILVDYDEHIIEERIIPEVKLSIRMPADFVKMEQGLAKKRYPGELPQVIFTDSEGETDLAFSLYEDRKTVNEEIPEIRNQWMEKRKENRRNKHFEVEGLFIPEEQITATFSYETVVNTDEVWKLVFLREVEGGLAVGSFTCLTILKDQWITIVKQMILTMKDIPRNGCQGICTSCKSREHGGMSL